MMLVNRTARTLQRALLAAGVALLVAAPAGATTDVLKRSFENMPQGLLDAALSPITAGHSIYTNLTTIEDTMPVRVAYAVPGYAWNVMCDFGGGLIRSITGVMKRRSSKFEGRGFSSVSAEKKVSLIERSAAARA